MALQSGRRRGQENNLINNHVACQETVNAMESHDTGGEGGSGGGGLQFKMGGVVPEKAPLG